MIHQVDCSRLFVFVLVLVAVVQCLVLVDVLGKHLFNNVLRAFSSSFSSVFSWCTCYFSSSSVFFVLLFCLLRLVVLSSSSCCSVLQWKFEQNTIELGRFKENEANKKKIPKTTNLKAGLGVHNRAGLEATNYLIFGVCAVGLWPAHGPRTVTQRAPFCRKNILWCFWVLDLACGRCLMWAPKPSVQHTYRYRHRYIDIDIYIYLYIYICMLWSY